jgi:hypothetical protein
LTGVGRRRKVKKQEGGLGVAEGRDVSVDSEGNQELRTFEYMRSGARVNSRVQLILEWIEAGASHAVEGSTLDIGPKGCMVVAPQGFSVGQKFRLKNKINKQECEATLIWRGHQGRTGWELGLELVNPPEDFWGMEF